MATATKSKRWKILSFRGPIEAPRRNFCSEKAKRGGAMRRDLLTMTETSLALGLIVWSFWGESGKKPSYKPSNRYRRRSKWPRKATVSCAPNVLRSNSCAHNSPNGWKRLMGVSCVTLLCRMGNACLASPKTSLLTSQHELALLRLKRGAR
jgi:hypothetical protein